MLRNNMEDPANKLNISPNLTIVGDIRAQIYGIKNKICKSILAEDKCIMKEIKELDDNKVTMEQIITKEV